MKDFKKTYRNGDDDAAHAAGESSRGVGEGDE